MAPHSFLQVMVFLTVVLGLVALYRLIVDLWLRDRERVHDRVTDQLCKDRDSAPASVPVFKDLPRLAAEANAADRRNPYRRLDDLLEASGVGLTPATLLAIAVFLGSLGAVAAAFWCGPVAAAVAGLGGVVAPFLWVHARARARRYQLEAQLPDVFESLANALRVGQTLEQALLTVSDYSRPPVSVELAYCHRQQSLGLPQEVALQELARRSGLLEMRVFVLATLVHQQTGGNLAELLDKLAGVVRSRFRVRRQVKTLTAEARLQALLLMCLPPLLFAAMFVVNPSYAKQLFDHPHLLWMTATSQVVGALWIRRIMHIDY